MINFSRTKPRRTGSRLFPLFPLLVALVAMVYPKNGKKSVCVYSKSAKNKKTKKWGNCALRHRRRLAKVCGNKMTPLGGVQNGRDAALPKPQFTIFSRPRVRPYMAASAGSLSKDSFALPPTQPSPVWKPPPTPLPRYRCALGNEHPYAANCGFGGSLATVALGRDSSVFLCLASPMLFVWVCVCVPVQNEGEWCGNGRETPKHIQPQLRASGKHWQRDNDNDTIARQSLTMLYIHKFPHRYTMLGHRHELAGMCKGGGLITNSCNVSRIYNRQRSHNNRALVNTNSMVI